MNYRHAYHVGNLGDVLKHIVLAQVIAYLKRKDKPFRIFDTHAGIGQYDLTSEATKKTGEWRDGIGRIMAKDMPPAVRIVLAPWLDVVTAQNAGSSELTSYPGSPALARALMRPPDRLTLTELHPKDFETLAALFAGDMQVKTIHLDGWLALNSFLPPKEKRGLVLIDPAYEVTDEFDRMTSAVIKGWAKWTSGIFALWYPLKNRRAINDMHFAFAEAGLRDVLALELSAGRSSPDSALLGSGMTIVNPPYTLAEDMATALPWLAKTLHQGPGSGWHVEQLIAE